MKNSEIQHIRKLFANVHEGLCEGDPPVSMNLQLSELYQVIKRLMDETSKTEDKTVRVQLATLEYTARKYKKELEDKLAVRN